LHKGLAHRDRHTREWSLPFSKAGVILIYTIIQQIFTMPIYGKEALNICHPYITDILRYTEMTIFGSECRFSLIACLAAILKIEVV